MIGEAGDTVVTLGWALAAWIAALAVVTAVVLHTFAVTVWWAWRALRRGVAAALSLVQHSSAPGVAPCPSWTVRRPHSPPCPLVGRHQQGSRMTVLWTTTELPGLAFDPEPDDEDDSPACRTPRDLWGQGITAHAARTANVIQPPARYL